MKNTKTTNPAISPDAASVDRLLNNLFADKRSVYIDDINFRADGGYDVSYCKAYTLQMAEPQWLDAELSREVLLNFITDEQLNHWESFSYDHVLGCLQPEENIDTDIETFLNENYAEVIKIYLER